MCCATFAGMVLLSCTASPSAEEVRISCRCRLPMFVARRAAVARIVFSCDILARWAATAFSQTAVQHKFPASHAANRSNYRLVREMVDGGRKGGTVQPCQFLRMLLCHCCGEKLQITALAVTSLQASASSLDPFLIEMAQITAKLIQASNDSHQPR